VAGSSPAARTILWVQRLEGWLSGYRHLTRNYILFRHRYAEKPVFTGSNPLSPPPVASSYFPLCLAVAGPFWGTLRGYGWGCGLWIRQFWWNGLGINHPLQDRWHSLLARSLLHDQCPQ